MELGETIPVLPDWFYLHFTENNGMAFGLEIGGKAGKLALSLFRIIAVFAIGWYIKMLYKQYPHPGLLISVSLVFAGAVGNITDSIFYGVVFSDSTAQQVAGFFPEMGGYSSLLHGRVVDMLYLPIFQGQFPDWFPFNPGQPFTFFSPVFNIADAAITSGVIILLFFQKTFLETLNNYPIKD